MEENKKAIIIGAGPAGLTAAFELLKRTNVKPIIFEASDEFGGISRTVNYKGNRIDIGGHRFFSKSDRITQWWEDMMPTQGKPSKDDIILEREMKLSEKAGAPDPEKENVVMLIRNRLSRIFFLRKFFDYPISLTVRTLLNLGPIRVTKIMFSYLKVRAFPIKEEKNLEDFFTNRFGRELYLTFFKDYTEKLWGVDCKDISPEWGAQRIKGLSISKAIIHAAKSIVKKKNKDIGQKNVETSLIERFKYPKYGPGQMWQETARKVKEMGGEIHMNSEVVGVEYKDGKIKSIKIKDAKTGEKKDMEGDYFFSSMPIKDLIKAFSEAPEDVKSVASDLRYRDFITVGLLLPKLKVKNKTNIKTVNDLVPDTWIYIQERDVKIGRLQIFNNWSPYMVKDINTVWIGLEYFCNEDDELWSMGEEEFAKFAIEELNKIDIIEKNDVMDKVVIKTKKAYPAYFGSYDRFNVVREFVDKIPNIYLVGRNGMHKYNNQDHSMLSSMHAVDNIVNNISSKDNIWATNTEKEYHESK